MFDFINDLFQGSMALVEPVLDQFVRWSVVLFASGAALGVLFIFVYACWGALSEGLRCEQRARCFLRLLEIGLKQGRTIEETIASMARSRIRDMGVPFHLVAGWMDRGLRLGAALEEVPRFLPPPVAAMLRVGEKTGNVAGLLPACRSALASGLSEANRQTNDLMVIFLISPAGPALIWVLTIFVLPRFRELGLDMGIPSDGVLDFCFAASLWVGTATALLWLGVWLSEAGRSGGQWLLRAVVRPARPWLDRLNLLIPWKRKRVQRDFSATLASLLDAGIDEAEAIRLAGEATANGVWQARAAAVVARLRQGVVLPDALAALDGTGEFQWRLRNAHHARPVDARSGHGFRQALAGWNESLEARAFQQEQLFSQVVSTGFVLLNGLTVGLVTVGVFHFLISAVEAVSW